MNTVVTSCPLCNSENEIILWQGTQCRVILVDDVDYPGYCRVIWQDHVKEMSDLNAQARHYVVDVMMAVEESLRELLQPLKMNLASFGNMVPHLHWHVIPRFSDDRHFPQPVWAPPQQPASAPRLFDRGAFQALLARKLNLIK